MASLPITPEPDATRDQFAPASSFLELVKYDRKSNTLDITFKSGAVHRYLFCFPATFDTFKQAPDHSSFYARAIRGKLPAVPIKSHNVGRERAEPLRSVKKKRGLDEGLQRVVGTVKRAGL